MSATVRMKTGTSYTGTMQIPAPSLAIVAVVNGTGSVSPADVPTAIRNGWTVAHGENWPAWRVVHLSAPAGGLVNGTLQLPDGNTAEVVEGNALIPHRFETHFLSHGWSRTPGLSALDV